MVLRGGRDLQTGRPDVLDGGVKVTQLGCDGLLVHWNISRRVTKTVAVNKHPVMV